MRYTSILILVLLIAMEGCNSLHSVFNNLTPYEKYIQSLDKASLLETGMAESWIKAGKQVLLDSVIIELPFSETGFFAAGEPEARSYQFDAKAGQILTVKGVIKASSKGRVFLDLFKLKKGQWESISYSDSVELVYEFDNFSQCLLRLQPELLVDLYYSITISVTPALINPVSKASNRSIGSYYGDVRDGGKRSHEGVDIFAPKGTPVLAPTTGYISRVGTNNLGGKVIWMRDKTRDHSYYFAHLDTQLVKQGIYVSQGDTLGLVGNTGNARSTPPHLHFGIYQHGSLDPLYYIRQMEVLAYHSQIDTSVTRRAHKILPREVNLRSGPGTSSGIMNKLEKDSYVKVIAQSKESEWSRVVTPDHQQGFILAKLLVPIDHVDNNQEKLIISPSYLLSQPDSLAVPVTWISDTTEVKVLATYDHFQFVKTNEGLTGWIE